MNGSGIPVFGSVLVDVYKRQAEKAAPFPLTGNDQLADVSRMGIKFHIHHKANALTIPNINDFFLAKFAKTHAAPHKTLLILCYALPPVR